MVKNFKDEFEIPNRMAINPGEPGTALVNPEEDGKVSQKRTTNFGHGLGKLLHMMHWSRPEIYNTGMDLSCHMSVVTEKHVKAIYKMMGYVDGTTSRG